MKAIKGIVKGIYVHQNISLRTCVCFSPIRW